MRKPRPCWPCWLYSRLALPPSEAPVLACEPPPACDDESGGDDKDVCVDDIDVDAGSSLVLGSISCLSTVRGTGAGIDPGTDADADDVDFDDDSGGAIGSGGGGGGGDDDDNTRGMCTEGAGLVLLIDDLDTFSPVVVDGVLKASSSRSHGEMVSHI